MAVAVWARDRDVIIKDIVQADLVGAFLGVVMLGAVMAMAEWPAHEYRWVVQAVGSVLLAAWFIALELQAQRREKGRKP